MNAYRILVLVQFAVAGAILANTLLALEARLAEVVRFERFQAHATRARPARRFARFRFGAGLGWCGCGDRHFGSFDGWGVCFRHERRSRCHFCD